MGILPEILGSVDTKQTIIETNSENPYGKTTFKFDFKSGDFVTDVMGNVVKTNAPEEVLNQVVNKILHDTRYRFLAYPDDYGNEIQLIFEQDEPFEVIECELKRLYEEALIYHPIIESVENFEASFSNDEITSTFDVVGVTGIVVRRTEVSNKWKAI